jgi:CubicO group peptidase (beta-lactamase class C family)
VFTLVINRTAIKFLCGVTKPTLAVLRATWSIIFALALLPLSLIHGDEWPTADPAALGLNTHAVEQYRVLCERSGADACLVAYEGTVVLEWYAPTYREPIYTMSSVKSWTALLVGMLVADGAIGSIDDPVDEFIPEWIAGSDAHVTIRHLLTMTGGLDTRSAQAGPRQSIGFRTDKNEFVFGLPLDFEPGSRWAYSNEGVQLLSPVIDRASGMPAGEYARIRLFEPLGMTRTSLNECRAGEAWTYADAETTLRDFARIGQLVLDEGWVRDEQIVSAGWISRCIEPISQNPHYGMLWWLHYREERNACRRFLFRRFPRLFGAQNQRVVPFAAATQGYLNTDCYVLPDDRIVAVRMQMNPAPAGAVGYNRTTALEILDAIVSEDR